MPAKRTSTVISRTWVYRNCVKGIRRLVQDVVRRRLGPENRDPTAHRLQRRYLAYLAGILESGDGVLVPNPGYPTYSSVSKLVEARLIPYELKEELGWQPDFEELEKMDLSNVKLMWTNYPNMPTGANASVELYEASGLRPETRYYYM